MNFRYLGIVLIAVILSCAKTPSSTTKDNETSWKDEDICVIHNTGPVALTSDTSELALTETAQCKSLQAIKIELALDGMFLKAVGFACTQMPGMATKAVAATIFATGLGLDAINFKLFVLNQPECSGNGPVLDQSKEEAKFCAKAEQNGMHCGKPGECQTSDSIKAWISNQNAPEGFCWHTVVDQTRRLSNGDLIPLDKQLRSGLQIAFLNREKNFADAQAACASIVGGGWHAPLSQDINATPQSADPGSSLENLGIYCPNPATWFWSASKVSGSTFSAWGVYLDSGNTNFINKNFTYGVLCVRP